ncbi:right-handed parallel beta-helix repeat-containing protein [Cyclobacterium plantarum]|uniref:right-handed parallel beta-helix repeat-containing protein n=1 Tax=Cyclobacterium plantarum TaxID=2716263 RepID=UPI00293BC827|nr:right-handed parallel beta-helix repeat-containing protein [Cyclobacterium plantarum]
MSKINCNKLLLFGFFLTVSLSFKLLGADYYFHPRTGLDANNGLSPSQAFQSLAKIDDLNLNPGDRIFLAAGEVFSGSLIIQNFRGTPDQPLIIEPFGTGKMAKIDAAGQEAGVLIENASFVKVKKLHIQANGPGDTSGDIPMRVGVLIRSTRPGVITSNIQLEGLEIEEVFYESAGYQRGAAEVKTANGTQKYGWGIRLIANGENQQIEQVDIKDCKIRNLAHTGIKLTGNNQQSIRNVSITGNLVEKVGGPGIQMSGVKFVYVAENLVSHSGSADDSRKWGRGSGLWTWGSSMVMIEKNQFLYANGPGDSAGAHIDFNCDNIILQYNLSAYNAGGFCEILGNNYNCAYRYNVSINDGHRIKGENGAFQEGKTLWLSGYQGSKKPRKGPVNSYIYNNTIYLKKDIVSKIAIDNRSKGVLIANNIFHIEGESRLVAGDQYKSDDEMAGGLEEVLFKNNLFLHPDNWPKQALIQPENSRYGNMEFTNPGGMSLEDYIPQKVDLLRGIPIPFLPSDQFGLINGLNLEYDILGNLLGANPGIGAIKPIEKP